MWLTYGAADVVCTLSGWMLVSGMIRLTLDENGNAYVRFLAGGATVSYMLARPTNARPAPPSTATPENRQLSSSLRLL
ncbi:hypothetical protein [Streptomyces sp. NPDC018045]|uniref:hypothetical protein n=1 Tax=Streptomyces sp. NPDC018045 TaxID=3365037 RepID=UPI0037BB01E1